MPLTGSGVCGSTGNDCVGFGLQTQTLLGLNSRVPNTDTSTIPALGQAFMLNDFGNGQVDPYSGSVGADGKPQPTDNYNSCVTAATALLGTGTDSHACAEYIASQNASQPSPTVEKPPNPCVSFIGPPLDCMPPKTTDQVEGDYSIKFVDCNNIDGGVDPNNGTIGGPAQ